jgi:hypothetical protein
MSANSAGKSAELPTVNPAAIKVERAKPALHPAFYIVYAVINQLLIGTIIQF